MKKKIVTTMGAFALILSLAFTGCSGNSDAEPKRKKKNTYQNRISQIYFLIQIIIKENM